MVQEANMPASVVITPAPMYSPQRSNETIVGANCLENFLYNIPRGSVMLTLPGVIILVIGGILVSAVNLDEGWADGNALICLIFLVLGGVWTIGALMFWLIVWCRYRPVVPSKKKSQARSEIELTMTPETPNGLWRACTDTTPSTLEMSVETPNGLLRAPESASGPEPMAAQSYIHRYPSNDKSLQDSSQQTLNTNSDSPAHVYTVE